MSREEFKQLFAKSWVAKKRVFFLFAEENGFALSQLYTTNPGAIGAISRHSKSFIIALTISSSLLIMERPDEHGYRNIFYGRIALREESGIKPNNRRRLSEDLVLSKRFDIKRVAEFIARPKNDILLRLKPTHQLRYLMQSKFL